MVFNLKGYDPAVPAEPQAREGLAEWFSSKFTLYRQGFDYSTPYLIIINIAVTSINIKRNTNECAEMVAG